MVERSVEENKLPIKFTATISRSARFVYIKVPRGLMSFLTPGKEYTVIIEGGGLRYTLVFRAKCTHRVYTYNYVRINTMYFVIPRGIREFLRSKTEYTVTVTE